MTDVQTETPVDTQPENAEQETVTVKPLSEFPQMLVDGVEILNGISKEHNDRTADLRKSTGSLDERIAAAAESSQNQDIIKRRERIQRALDQIETLKSEIAELAKAEVTDILSPEQIEAEQKAIATLRKDWSELFAGSFGMFKIMCKLTDDDMELVKKNYVTPLVTNGRKSHTGKAANAVTGDGATRKRIKAATITVDGDTSTVVGNDGKAESVTIGNVVARLKNYDIKLSSTEFTKQVTDKYDKGNGWDDVPNSAAVYVIPAATTDNPDRSIIITFDKK